MKTPVYPSMLRNSLASSSGSVIAGMCLTLGFLSTLLNPGCRVRHDPLHPVRCVDGPTILDKPQSPQHLLRRDVTNNSYSQAPVSRPAPADRTSSLRVLQSTRSSQSRTIPSPPWKILYPAAQAHPCVFAPQQG
ncbi:hypothetical protein [Prosthecochloris sp.]|uniref:hypothetical protein n=1 Tax=Prosthecochloris sp. TaxID=290513 RepID=UPI00257EDD3B|nr:hypothetical protein [Prosthecochloris sp.]